VAKTGPKKEDPTDPVPGALAWRRFYLAPESIQGEVAVLDPEESHHLARVLRLEVGATVAVGDGRGRNWEAVVASLEPDGVTLRLVRPLNPWGESALELTLGIGLAKGDALDAVIRQATEMGVKRILPFRSVRAEKLAPERAARRLERWQRLAQESLKSCQRSCLPEISAPQEFSAVLPGPEPVKLIFWEEERAGGLKLVIKAAGGAARILIGPEGGFTAGEVAQAQEAGFQVVSLGPRRLKVETAALAALALMQYAWGDLG
jgi:16S rRNA (uracil1498-N3)-methyltransferase